MGAMGEKKKKNIYIYIYIIKREAKNVKEMILSSPFCHVYVRYMYLHLSIILTLADKEGEQLWMIY